ncbi:TIGR03564 family F420-dependent LLM class oxidoreductase [Pseudonocardia eucalypti]|uniref:TIGR03564 family F420-dependent LLM class oxidoreductase n=1 Tax=Pseudonocardia eucalypti TaxID=648755 RepID=A0ABP9PV40_9PSEU|nr:F420-dependent oxidoreductase-like protein [Pseudonocardia eucalypti]
MELGIVLPQPASDAPTPANLVETTIEQARLAVGLGVRSAWFAQRMDFDAIALAGLVGRELPELTVGTSVVPIIGRHPLVVAAQTRTTQAATGGRFQLGLGLGARNFLEPLFGVTEPRTITQLREFLTVLDPLLRTGEVDFAGQTLTARTAWSGHLPGAQPPPVLVAAMGPKALRVTGELADGTLPYLAGPKTLAEHVVPTITEAASAAGRPAARVATLVATVVTDRAEEIRARAVQEMAFYETIPSYRAMLDREGVARAGELAAIGSAEQVAEQLRAYRDAGATELVLSQTTLGNTEEQLRTWQLAEQARDW